MSLNIQRISDLYKINRIQQHSDSNYVTSVVG